MILRLSPEVRNITAIAANVTDDRCGRRLIKKAMDVAMALVALGSSVGPMAPVDGVAGPVEWTYLYCPPYYYLTCLYPSRCNRNPPKGPETAKLRLATLELLEEQSLIRMIANVNRYVAYHHI